MTTMLPVPGALRTSNAEMTASETCLRCLREKKKFRESLWEGGGVGVKVGERKKNVSKVIK